MDRRRTDRGGEKVVKQSLRVDAKKIDSLMNQVGELVVSRARFSQLFNEMRRRNQKYGMVTACVGGGQGVAGIYELLN